MAGWKGEAKAYEWYLYNRQENLNDYVWRECYRLVTVEYEFTVAIEESKKLKRDKFIVQISGCQKFPSRHSWQGGYTDRDYLKSKYGKWVSGGWVGSTFHQSYYSMPEGLELEKKFKKLEDAQKFASIWQAKLEADHLDHIMKGRDIIKTINSSR